jgi:Flp pilus assembly pilin Flp
MARPMTIGEYQSAVCLSGEQAYSGGDPRVVWTHLLRQSQPEVATNANRRFSKGGTVLLVLHREEGQGLAEYALILALIAILAVFALMFMSGNLTSLLSTIGNGL